jgi:hypothetical protein
MAGQDLVGQGAHLVEVLRRVDLRDAERGERPDPVLVEQHPQAHRLLPEAPATTIFSCSPSGILTRSGVADADVDGDLVGAAVTPLLQPHRQPGAATGGVDHQVGRHGFASVEVDPGHPAAFEDRFVDQLSPVPRWPALSPRRRICHSRNGRLGM